MDPSSVTLSENFGSISGSLTGPSLLVLLEQNYLNGFHGFVDWPHNHPCSPRTSQWPCRAEGGASSRAPGNGAFICTARVLLVLCLLLVTLFLLSFPDPSHFQPKQW